MNYYVKEKKEEYKILLLVPEININNIRREYFKENGIKEEDVMIVTLYQEPNKKKTSASIMKEYLNEEIKPIISDFNINLILVADAEYFKVVAKVTKVSPNLGYILPSIIDSIPCIYIPNVKAVFFDPERTKLQINQALQTINSFFEDKYLEPGTGIIKFAEYPDTNLTIKNWLIKLVKENKPLTCDIEAYSLKHYDAGIGSITLCWNENEGIAFKVDNAKNEPNKERRNLLRWFFENFNNTLIYHNIAYDVYVLIYQLYMKHLLDTEGMLKGFSILLKNWEDTKLISYLATNSCAGNSLGLKDQSQEFAGNYAKEDIGDITQIPITELLQYNLTDGLSTWYVYNKNYPIMVKDNQLDIYEKLFKPATVDIIQMQLTGLPVNMQKVQEIKLELQQDADKSYKAIINSPIIQEYQHTLKEEWVSEKNKTLKKKQVTIEDATKIFFKPNSVKQLQRLLYEELNLPIIELTKTKAPATGQDTLKALINHTDNDNVKALLQALIDNATVDKILSTFIPALETAQKGNDNWHYLFGNFNLGGTVSGRLSSSNPNLQNLPATGTKYAKAIKSCFQAPPGWLFCGLDFASLEDRISALTTKDTNKLKVYSDHYDGHCLRAYAYFKDQMPDITAEIEKEPEREVEIINSIKHRYKHLRQLSKGPTFCLTYGGTNNALMKIFGFSKEEALSIENRYHELYKESDKWVADHIKQAGKDGYVTVAFGLRVRTPLLKQTIRGLKVTPHEAEAEARTAGNALGQSWCLLNSRAGVEFNSLLRNSNYKLDIKPCAQIHDAQYFLVRDSVDTILFANKHLVKAVQWQDDPVIAHPTVKLGGEFSIFYPDWGHELSLPNDLTENKLISLVDDFIKENQNE